MISQLQGIKKLAGECSASCVVRAECVSVGVFYCLVCSHMALMNWNILSSALRRQ